MMINNSQTIQTAVDAVREFERVTPRGLIIAGELNVSGGLDDAGSPIVVVAGNEENLRRSLPSFIRTVEIYQSPGVIKSVPVVFKVAGPNPK